MFFEYLLVAAKIAYCVRVRYIGNGVITERLGVATVYVTYPCLAHVACALQVWLLVTDLDFSPQ